MEPEKAQHQNAKNKLKPQTSIMKPEELIKEMEEANGFSEWQGAFNGDDSNSNIPKEEMLGTEDTHVSVDIEAIVREVEETLDADNGDTVDEVGMAERDKATEVVPAEKEVEDSAAVPNLMEGATEAEDDTTKKTSIAMPVQNVAENVAKLNFLFRVMNRAMSPIFGREIQKDVPKNTIKGAWISGAVISMMGGLDPVTSAISALGLSYVSITPGSAGDVVRAAGEATWDAGLIALKVTSRISAAFGLGYNTADIPAVAVDSSSADLVPKEAISVGEDIAMLVEEVEGTVLEVESVLERSNKARAAIAEEEAQIAEAERLSEEARLAEIEYLLEGAKIEKEAQEAEQEFLAEEARLEEEERLAEMARLEEDALIAEEERLAEEARLEEEEKLVEEERMAELARAEEARLAEEERFAEEERLAGLARAAEEASLAEEERLAEEGRLAEMARVEAEARIAEEKQLAEEARLEELEEKENLAEEERLAEMAHLEEEARIAEEERLAEEARLEEEEISDEEWEASIQLAQGLSPDLTGENGGWDAARQLAKDLVDEPEEEQHDFNNPDLTDEERMDLIGRAARAAVEEFEAAKQHEDDLEVLEKTRRNEVKSILEEVNGLVNETKGETEVDNTNVEQPEVDNTNVEQPNYQKMTVVDLKGILRTRGLKISGKKAMLIERLQEDDA